MGIDKTSFWGALFDSCHRRRVPEPEQYRPGDYRSGVAAILQSSGMTEERLAMRLGVMPNTLRTVQSRNIAKPPLCEALSQIACEFSLPLLAEWFTVEGKLQIHRKHQGKQKPNDF